MSFSYEQIFAYLLETDEGYIRSWEGPDPNRGEDFSYSSDERNEFIEHRGDFMVITIANFRYWFTSSQVEAGYRGLCKEHKNKFMDEERKRKYRRIRRKIHQISCRSDIDFGIKKQLHSVIDLLDSMYDLLI